MAVSTKHIDHEQSWTAKQHRNILTKIVMNYQDVADGRGLFRTQLSREGMTLRHLSRQTEHDQVTG